MFPSEGSVNFSKTRVLHLAAGASSAGSFGALVSVGSVAVSPTTVPGELTGTIMKL